jgi:formylglycine-generating enzyme required for sulfatase activity
MKRIAPLVILLMLAACGAPSPAPTPTATAKPPDPTAIQTVTPAPAAAPTQTSAAASPSATDSAAPDDSTLPERITDDHGVEMVLIPAGEFIMGTDTGYPDERPAHAVYLDAYYIDLTETTNAQFRECVEAGACDPPDYEDCCASPGTDWYSMRPDYFTNPEYDDYPVTWLSWNHAQQYCTWRGARLPTEAEWEKAARGTDERIFPWGNEEPAPNLANFIWWEGDFEGRPPFGTTPVGSYPDGASPYGVLDMAGNLYEWVADLYSPDYYANSPYENPQGPPDEIGTWQIARGGSFWNKPERQRAPNRNHAYLPPDVGHFDAGVRCAQSAE